MSRDYMRHYRKLEQPEDRVPGGFNDSKKRLKYRKKRSKTVSVQGYMRARLLLSVAGFLLAGSVVGAALFYGVRLFITGEL